MPTLSKEVSALIQAAGLEVMSDNITGFSHGGATLVWVLAESHVVLHFWSSEGFVTLDIHVCDYTSSNAAKAARLRSLLEDLCFASGVCEWRELVLPHPTRPDFQPTGV